MNSVMPMAAPTAFWQRPMVIVLGVFVLLPLLFWRSTASLLELWWTSGTYGHGLLLAPVSAYLIWERRAELSRAVPRSSYLGLVSLVFACAIWWSADVTDTQALQQVGLLAMVVGVIWALLGGGVLRLLAFPLAYLWLGVQLWTPLEPLLQHVTVTVVSHALLLAGVPILVEGSYISVPSGGFLVEDVCAGLRFLLASLAVATLFAHVNGFSLKRGSLFVAIAFVLAVASNWIRVFVVVLVGHLTEMQHPLVNDHAWFGWVLFAIMLIPLLWLGRRMSPTSSVETELNVSLTTARSSVVVSVAVLSLVLVSAATASWMKTVESVMNVHLTAPAAGESWIGPQQAHDVWRPVFNGVDAETSVQYWKGDDNVQLYLGYYAQQHQGKELINDLNSIYDAEHWVITGDRVHTVTLRQSVTFSVREISVRFNGIDWLIWSWYQVGDQATASSRWAKLLQVWDILGPRQGAAVVAVATHSGYSQAQRRDVLSDLLGQLKIDYTAGPRQYTGDQ